MSDTKFYHAVYHVERSDGVKVDPPQPIRFPSNDKYATDDIEVAKQALKDLHRGNKGHKFELFTLVPRNV